MITKNTTKKNINIKIKFLKKSVKTKNICVLSRGGSESNTN